MQLELITPEKIVLKQEIDALIVETSQGQITILPSHANLVTKVSPGEMIIKVGGRELSLAVTGGFLEIHNDTITILADYAVRSEDIEADKALKAQERAREILKRKAENISEQDLALAESELRRSVLELHVVNKRKRQRV